MQVSMSRLSQFSSRNVTMGGCGWFHPFRTLVVVMVFATQCSVKAGGGPCPPSSSLERVLIFFFFSLVSFQRELFPEGKNYGRIQTAVITGSFLISQSYVVTLNLPISVHPPPSLDFEFSLMEHHPAFPNRAWSLPTGLPPFFEGFK